LCKILPAGQGDQLTVDKAFGEVLKRHRSRSKLSQNKLAELSELDRTYVSLLERGLRQPTLLTLIKLAGALKVEPSDLVSETMDRIGASHSRR
jgi:transcriptional regulator with XRE-family HTH domain